jgi:hypothetical protein
MSSDPLPLPEIWSDLPKGDAYERTRAESVANGRSGLVLIEYASGFAQSDPQPVIRPPERASNRRQANAWRASRQRRWRRGLRI